MMVEDPCDKVIRIVKGHKQKQDYVYEENVALIDFLIKSKFGHDYMNRVSSLHRLSCHLMYEYYEKGRTIYTNMDQLEHTYILLKGRVALLECKNIEDLDYHRQRDQQFEYDRSLSQHQANQQAKQLMKRCELQSYDSFGFNHNLLKIKPNSTSQLSDHIALVLEPTHLLLLKAKIIQENYIQNHLLNCKYLGQQLKVEYTLLNDIICEQCFKKKGMFICSETNNPRFIYCVLFGSVLYQDSFSSGISKNRVVLGQGALIGQTIKQEKPITHSKIQFQQLQTASLLQKQKCRFNGIQLSNFPDVKEEEIIDKEQVEREQSTAHSSSEYTVMLMIDKYQLSQKLSEQKKQQNNNSQLSTKIQNYEIDHLFKKRKPQYLSEKVSPIKESPSKGRLLISKKTRSQSYSIVSKLIQKEDKSNSFARIKNQFVEFHPSCKKEYLQFDSPVRRQQSKEQSLNQSHHNSVFQEKNENQTNDYEDIIKRLTEKNAFPFNASKEQKYNRILMKNLRDKDQIARMIVESKKPMSLNMYYSNRDNFVNKDSLMQQFHTKYLKHKIEEDNKRNESSLMKERYITYENEDYPSFNINSLQSESDIDKFIQKINSQLINYQSQSNQQSTKRIKTAGNDSNIPLNEEKDKINHLTENSQQLFYPYRVQEMLDQFISLKKQESGLKETESIQFRKQSIPSVNCKLQHQMNDPLLLDQQMNINNQQNQYVNYYPDFQNENCSQNNYNSYSDDHTLPQSIQQIDEINELNSNEESLTNLENQNQNRHAHQMDFNLQIKNKEQINQEIHLNDQFHSQQLSKSSSNQSFQKNKIIQYYAQSNSSKSNIDNNIQRINEEQIIPPISNTVLRSQSVHNIIRQNQGDIQRIISTTNPIYPNIKQRSLSKNSIEMKQKKNEPEGSKFTHKILQLTELRMKRKQEFQLNRVLSQECRNNVLLQIQQPYSSLISTHHESRTLQNSQKSSRRQSSIKGRPTTSNSSSNQISITSKQMVLSQFTNNLQLDQKKLNSKITENEIIKAPSRTIVFSSGDRRYSKQNQQKQNQESQQTIFQKSRKESCNNLNNN